MDHSFLTKGRGVGAISEKQISSTAKTPEKNCSREAMGKN